MAYPLCYRDREILSCLREDGRQALTSVGNKTGTPVSTVFDRLKVLESRVIRKHSSLLDFLKLGYLAHVFLVLGTKNRGERDGLTESLRRQPCVNAVFKICSMTDRQVVIAEVVLPGLLDVERFMEGLNKKFELVEQHIFHVSEEVLREGFLADRQTAKLIPEGQEQLEEMV